MSKSEIVVYCLLKSNFKFQNKQTRIFCDVNTEYIRGRTSFTYDVILEKDY